MTGDEFMEKKRTPDECSAFLKNAHLFINDDAAGEIEVRVDSPFGPTLCKIPRCYKPIAIAMMMGRYTA